MWWGGGNEGTGEEGREGRGAQGRREELTGGVRPCRRRELLVSFSAA